MVASDRLTEMARKFHDKLFNDAEDALTHMDYALLTDDQRFALAVLAGAEYHYDTEARLWRTVTPVHVDIVNGEVQVSYYDRSGDSQCYKWRKPSHVK